MPASVSAATSVSAAQIWPVASATGSAGLEEEAGLEEAGFEDSAGLEEAAGWEEAGLDAGAELAGAAGSQAARPKAANAPKSVRTFFFIEIVLLQLIGCFSFLFLRAELTPLLVCPSAGTTIQKAKTGLFARSFITYILLNAFTVCMTMLLFQRDFMLNSQPFLLEQQICKRPHLIALTIIKNDVILHFFY